MPCRCGLLLYLFIMNVSHQRSLPASWPLCPMDPGQRGAATFLVPSFALESDPRLAHAKCDPFLCAVSFSGLDPGLDLFCSVGTWLGTLWRTEPRGQLHLWVWYGNSLSLGSQRSSLPLALS